MGGMAAQIPIKNDPAANEAALEKVRADKEREANDGHDGTWVAHPGLVPIAMEVFDARHDGPEPDRPQARGRRRHRRATCSRSSPRGRSPRPACAPTSASASSTSTPGSAGSGCVPIYNLMEDAATAEISRSQVWQWIHSPKGVLDDGRKITASCSAR